MTTAETQTLDPSKYVDVYSGEQVANVFEGLNRLNNKNQVVPGVATSTTESKDGLTWTFKLRKNAKWSNGDPVTAQDFVYSMRRKLDPKTKSQQQNEQSISDVQSQLQEELSKVKDNVENLRKGNDNSISDTSPASIFSSNSEYASLLLSLSKIDVNSTTNIIPIISHIANVFIPFFNFFPP